MKKEIIDSSRKDAAIAGLLFVVATLSYSIGTTIASDLYFQPDFLSVINEHKSRMAVGIALILVEAASVCALSLFMFGLLKKDNERTAVAYVLTRGMEGLFFGIQSIALVALIGVSAQVNSIDGIVYSALGDTLIDLSEWAYHLGFGGAFTANAILLNRHLIKYKCVPLPLSLWGLLSAILIPLYYIMWLLFQIDLQLMFIPFAIQEMVFALYLIFRGLGKTRGGEL